MSLELNPLLVPAALVVSIGLSESIFGIASDAPRLIYDVDNPALLERLAVWCGGIGAVESHRLWHVYFKSTHDQNGTLAQTVWSRRTPIHCVARRCLPSEVQRRTVEHSGWPGGFCFFRIDCSSRKSRFAGVPYHELTVSIEQTSFVRRGPFPDTQVVGQTWRFVGTSRADLTDASNNNRQLPVVAYLSSACCLGVGYMSSSRFPRAAMWPVARRSLSTSSVG